MVILVTIIDSPCGAGKTQYCIDLMKRTSREKRYVYITPFLNEIKRIMENVPNVYTPDNANKRGTKIEGIKILLDKYDKHIASTHALFRLFTPEMAEIIKAQKITLIMDEVMDVVEVLKIKPSDMKDILNHSKIEAKTGKLLWVDEEYNGDSFEYIRQLCKSNNIYIIDGTAVMWTFPIEVFEAFESVIICTYMFKAQLQRFYYDLYKLPYEIKSVSNNMIVDYRSSKSNTDKIKIYLGNLNNIGDIEGNKTGALSVSWYNSRKEPSLALLQSSIFNFIHNELRKELGYLPKSSDVIWTTFKPYVDKLKGKGYTKGFIACNLRATNDYADRHIVVYAVNRFFNPYAKKFFASHGISITKTDEDNYALAEMIQFIYRSAVRNGEQIYCFIPAERVRNLMFDYIAPSA